MNFEEVCNVCGMVRFHMLYDQIIRFPVTQNLLNIIQPFVGKIGIYGIHNCNFFVQDHIGVIGHAVWHFVLAFKKVNLMIINAYIFDSICDFHIWEPPVCGICFLVIVSIPGKTGKFCCKSNKIGVC